MKKLVSLLLALCLVLGLAACTPKDNAEDTKPEDTKPAETKDTTPAETDPTEPENPYAGTEIEVWGIAKNQYEDITTVNAGSFWDLTVVAMWEWCEANDVTLKFGGAWNRDAYMAAVAGGQTPDLIFTYGYFPNFANLGLTKGLTAEGTAAIGAIAGEGYLTALEYKGEAHGVLLPVNGNEVVWYNRTIMENYGVKTPKEYWEEGNWNWDTLIQCMKEVTKDVDGDGVNDTYAISTNFLPKLYNGIIENADGSLTHALNTDKYRAFADMCYNGVTEGWLQIGTQDVFKLDGEQQVVFRFGDCELYNMGHVYRTLDNGEYLEVVPMPKYDESEEQMNNRLTYALYNGVANDNQAATEAMLAYVQDCCMKYMADISMGAVTTECQGLQGTCDLSALFLEKHAERLENDKAYLELPHYDADHVANLFNLLCVETPSTTKRSYSGVDDPVYPTDSRWAYMFTEPAASSVPKVIEAIEKQIANYNSMYVF